MKGVPLNVWTSKKTCWRRSSLKLLQKSASSVPFAVCIQTFECVFVCELVCAVLM